MSLIEKVHNNQEIGAYHGRIPVNYVYSFGLAGENFFRAIKDKGSFLASRCDKCGVTYFPARVFCEQCMSHLPDTLEVPGDGAVYSFTLCHRNMDGSVKDKPDLMALIKIDGTDGMLVHYLSGVGPEDVEIGMQVKPVLKAKKDREGNVFDVKHFAPVK